MSQEIGVIGSPEFTTGFRLAGIREFANVPEEDKPVVNSGLPMTPIS